MNILIPTAGQKAAADTAEYAIQVAASLDARVFALHVIKPGNAKEAGELSLEYFQDAGQANEVAVETHFREGRVIPQIVEFAREHAVDLIMLGASLGGVYDKWLVSDLRDSTPVPVLVIPYQMFASDDES